MQTSVVVIEMDKINSFSCFILKLSQWFSEENPGKPNDLSVLKVLKLLFLATAAEIETHDKKELEREESLLSIFNNFRAFPLGHVEFDIYNKIKLNKGNFQFFKINNSSLELSDNIEDALNLPGVDLAGIENAIGELKARNKDLINYPAYNLVALTHKWDSWKFFYSGNNRASVKIPNEIIIKEKKIFF